MFISFLSVTWILRIANKLTKLFIIIIIILISPVKNKHTLANF